MSRKKAGLCVAALCLLFGRFPVSWLLSNRQPKGPKFSRHPNRSGYVSSPTGNRIYVECYGDRGAQALVLVHGINADRTQWDAQIAEFEKDYYMVLIDLPGHGRSSEPVSLSIDTLALDLSAVLTRLNVFAPVLHGHSLGGMIIQEYCKKKLTPAPKAIILQHCSYTNPLRTMPISPLPWLLERILISPLLQSAAAHSRSMTLLGYLAYTSGLSAVFYRLVLFTGRQDSATLRQLCWLAAHTKVSTTANALLATFKFKSDHVLPRLDMPCLVISAIADRLIDPSACLHLYERIPGSSLQVVSGGHQSLAEFPEQTNLAVANFLRKVK